MKKQLFLLGVILPTLFGAASAQIEMSVRDSVIFEYAPISNSAYMPTGHLYDKAIGSVDIGRFSGSTYSDTCSFSTMKQLLWQHDHSFLLENRAGIESTTNFEAIAGVMVSGGILPITLILQPYNFIAADAFSRGLLDTNEFSQIVETTIADASAYAESTLVAASFWTSYTNNNLFRIFIAGDQIINNSGLEIIALEIDLGSGFVPLPLDEVYNYTYNGEPGTVVASLRILLNDNSTQYCNFNIIYSNNAITNVPPDFVSQVMTATIPFSPPSCANINTGQYGKARYYVQYAVNNTSQEIKKPLIFVEGFDPRISVDLVNHRYGNLGWDVFRSGGYKFDGELTLPNLQSLPALLDDLRSPQNNYDIIYVDFANGGDYIQKNAFALVRVLQEINATKVGTEDLVVVGTSMGGLLSRYALSYMEKNNLTHCTRLWVSFDAPHNGANIPPGLQFGVNFFANFDQDAFNGNNDLNSPAAAQMLLRHVGRLKEVTVMDPTCYRTNLVDALNTIGFPELPRKIAMLNGSATTNAVDNFGFSQDICNIKVDILFKTRVQFNVNTQPQVSGVVFKGAFSRTDGLTLKTWPRTWSMECSSCSFLNYDGAPGGTNRTTGDFFDATKKGIIDKGFSIDFEYLRNGGSVNFISATSAIGLFSSVSTDPFYNIAGNIDVDYTRQEKTPFEAYIYDRDPVTNTGINNPHVTPTNANKIWLLQQLKDNEYKLPISLPNVAGATLNMASGYQRQLKSINVNNGGLLQINGFYKDMYGSITDASPFTNNTIKVFTNECLNSTVNINSGGKLFLGDNNTLQNRAELTLVAGTTLIIKSGGELRVYNNSKLIIKPGAKLVIEPGAIINLTGSNAIIENSGLIEVMNNALLTKTGTGFFRIKNHNGIAVKLNGNAKIEYNGLGFTDKIIEVENSQAEITSTQNGQVNLNNARVNFVNGKLNVRTALNLTSTIVSGNGDGLVATGNHPIVIDGCTFESTNKGIEIYYTNPAGIAAEIHNSTFATSEYGIKVYGRSFNISNCSFGDEYSYQAKPIYAENFSLNGTITNCTFEGFANKAIYLNGSSLPTISIDNILVGNSSSSSYAMERGIQAINCNVTMKCSEIFCTSTAIELGLNATLDMSNSNASVFGNNTISKVAIDWDNLQPLILLNSASQLYLRNGYNNFKKHTTTNNSNTTCYFIAGGLQPFSQTIDAINNYWFASNSSDNDLPNSNGNIDMALQKTSIDYSPIAIDGEYDNQCLISYRLFADPCYDPENCNTAGGVLNDCIECNTVKVKGKAVNKALKIIIKQMRNDTLKLNTYQHYAALDSIIGIKYNGNKPKVELVKDRAQHLLYRQFGDLNVQTSDSLIIKATRLQLNAGLVKRLQRAVQKSDTSRIVQLNLALAHSSLLDNAHYKAVARFDDALSYLSAGSTEYYSVESQKCLVMVEDLYEKGSISDSLRSAMMLSCEVASVFNYAAAAREIMTQSTASAMAMPSIKFQPNPVVDFVELSLENFFTDGIKVEVLDLTGRVISTLIMEANNNRQKVETLALDLRTFSPGTYIVSVSSNKILLSKRLIKN
jgi:hypothetical protein